MFALHLECSVQEKDRLIAELWQQGTAGIIEEDAPGARARLTAFFDQPIATAELAAWNPRWETVPDRDWIQVSQSQWSPLEVGARFYLVPAWSQAPAPPGRIRLVMNPGQACGTGWHPATQLCLQAMERHVAPGSSLLDLGTGSGILAVAASLLGASPVYACDMDPAAVFATRLPKLFLGSARSVRSASLDVVVANINAQALLALAPQLARIRKAASRLILSGFRRPDLERVQAAFPARTDLLEQDDWIALVV
ncbi:MAG: 50S ribosomal protein L11 methyltransferase [Bryobacteraceae bacterium]